MQYKEKLGTQIEEQEKKLQMMEKEVTTKLSNAPSIYCVAFGLLVLSCMGFLMCVCECVVSFFFSLLAEVYFKKACKPIYISPVYLLYVCRRRQWLTQRHGLYCLCQQISVDLTCHAISSLDTCSESLLLLSKYFIHFKISLWLSLLVDELRWISPKSKTIFTWRPKKHFIHEILWLCGWGRRIM